MSVPLPGAHRPVQQLGSQSYGSHAPGPTPAVDPDLAEAVTARVHDLVAQVDEIGVAAADEFDLGALNRQAQLLEQAHEELTSALSEVDRR